jgi:hypothetical protein
MGPASYTRRRSAAEIGRIDARPAAGVHVVDSAQPPSGELRLSITEVRASPRGRCAGRPGQSRRIYRNSPLGGMIISQRVPCDSMSFYFFRRLPTTTSLHSWNPDPRGRRVRRRGRAGVLGRGQRHKQTNVRAALRQAIARAPAGEWAIAVCEDDRVEPFVGDERDLPLRS